ncbi:MAG: Ig-like domain-containing protein [Bacteroidota bacterium]
MRKILLFLLCLLYLQPLVAQVAMRVGAGTHMIVSGAAHLVTDTGSFVNNGTYTDSTGTFKAAGGVTFSGTGTTRLNSLVISNGQHSVMNAQVSVYNTAELQAGHLNANNNLYIRSDANTTANLVVTGTLANHVKGLIARASVTSGSCPSYTSNFTVNISGPVVNYQWQSSADSAAWSNLGGATNATYTATVTATTFYRCHFTTTNSSYSQSTPGVRLYMPPPPSVASIAGTAVACAGATATLSDATAGGTWSSANTAVATVNSTGGVTGVAAGTAVISYTVTNACGSASAVKTVTVNPLATAGTISGPSTVFTGSSVTLSSTSGGGTWASTNTSVATVNSSGVVTGVNVGTVTISYTVANSCGSATATRVMAVNSPVDPITGTLTVCAGSATTLGSATGGGTWASNNTGVATVSGAGVVSAVAAGIAVITYTAAGGYTTAAVTINGLPAVITGTAGICAGTATTLSTTSSGGMWSSSNTAVGTVSSSGVVSGVGAGTAVISYTNSAGCARTVIVTVNAQPGAITGTAAVCIGTTTTLANSVSGGAWTGGTSGNVNVNSSGVVTGVAAGTAIVSYTTSGSCRATIVVTVNSIPPAITGTMKACPGTTTTLFNTTSGGSWTSASSAIATIHVSDGLVTGVAAGTVVMTYTTGSGCYRTAIVTVNAAPAAITGTTTVCVGSTTALASATTPGVSWTSSSTSTATINSTSGVATGVAPGMTTITYTLGSGCLATTVLTVTSAPSIIGGPSGGCVGTTVTMTNTASGGTWTSSNTTAATVGATDGVVTGLAYGNTYITYSLGGSCYRTKLLTINTSPPAISGIKTACTALTTTLTSGSGGTWASSSAVVGTISVAGVVTGVSAGTTNITYTGSSGCYTTAVVTVISMPPAITGVSSLCSAQSTTLANTTAGGTWLSGNGAIASVGSTSGVVLALGTMGTVVITYGFGGACRVTKSLTVNPLPAAIGGTYSVCATAVTTLSNVTSGGTWSSSNTAVGTVGTGASASYGAVRGLTAGMTNISYTITATGCARTATVTVEACSRPAGSSSTGNWQLYPNPTTGSFTVQSASVGVLLVYTVDGKEIVRYDVKEGNTSMTLPKEIARGIYMCRFSGTDGKTVIVRLEVE